MAGKKLFALLITIFLVILAGASTCVNLSDSTTFAGKIIGGGSTNYVISGDTVLCPGRYELGDKAILLKPDYSGSDLDCAGATIVGPGKVPGSMGGIAFACYGVTPYNTCTINSAVRNCVVENSNIGIKATNANGVTIENNTVRNVFFGISVSGSRTPIIRGNTIEDSEIDGLIVSDGIGGWKTIGAEIRNNRIVRTGQYGLRVSLTNSSTIEGNWVEDAGYATGYIYLTNANSIYNNRFGKVRVSNSTDAWNIAKTLGTNIVGGPNMGGNYWTNYTGTDSDGDGLGDSPHSEPMPSYDKGSPLVDNLPLVQYVPPVPESCPFLSLAKSLKISAGSSLPSSIPYGNERFNILIGTNISGSAETRNAVLVAINCTNLSNPTYVVSIKGEKTIKDILSSKDPVGTLDSKMSSKEIVLKGKSIGKRIKSFFTGIGIKIASFFSKRGK